MCLSGFHWEGWEARGGETGRFMRRAREPERGEGGKKNEIKLAVPLVLID